MSRFGYDEFRSAWAGRLARWRDRHTPPRAPRCDACGWLHEPACSASAARVRSATEGGVTVTYADDRAHVSGASERMAR